MIPAERSALEAAPVTYAMRLGRKVYPVRSLADASRIFCAARDAYSDGASSTPLPIILRNGVQWGHVSYNGRVWAFLPDRWIAGAKPVYDPADGIDSEAARSRA